MDHGTCTMIHGPGTVVHGHGPSNKLVDEKLCAEAAGQEDERAHAQGHGP